MPKLSIKELEERILETMKPGVLYARSHLIKWLGITPLQWKQCVPGLVEQGKLVRTGEKRGTRYQLAVEKGEPDKGRRLLSPRAQNVFKAFEPNQVYSRSQLFEKLDISVSGWNRAIAELVEADLVLRTGDRRGARYQLSQNAPRQGELFGQVQSAVDEAKALAHVQPKSLSPKEDTSQLDEQSAAIAVQGRTSAKEAGTEAADQEATATEPAEDAPETTAQVSATEDELQPKGSPETAAQLSQQDESSATSLEPAAATPEQSLDSGASASSKASQPAFNYASLISDLPIWEQRSSARKNERRRFEMGEPELREIASIPPGQPMVAMVENATQRAEFWNTIVALANSGGGWVIVGVRTRDGLDFFVKGLRDASDLRHRLAQEVRDRARISHPPFSSRSIRKLEIRRRQVLVIRVRCLSIFPPLYAGFDSYSKRPHQGVFVIRRRQVVKCTPAEVEAMWRHWVEPDELKFLPPPQRERVAAFSAPSPQPKAPKTPQPKPTKPKQKAPAGVVVRRRRRKSAD